RRRRRRRRRGDGAFLTSLHTVAPTQQEPLVKHASCHTLANLEVRSDAPAPRRRKPTAHQRMKAFCYPKEVDFLGGSCDWCLVSLCAGTISAQCYSTRGQAKAAKKSLDALGCAGCCRGFHVIRHLGEES